MSVKIQSPISIDKGSDCPMSRKDVTDKNKTLVNVTKSVLLLGLCCFALTVRGISSSFKSKESSPDVLLDKISKLTRDLDAFDRLKKGFVNDEIELQWDQQHISDLEQRISNMKLGFEHFQEYEHAVEDSLRSENRDMKIAIAESAKQMQEDTSRDYVVLGTLAHEVKEATIQLEGERNLNIALQKTLDQMTKELEKQRNLRGVRS